MKEAERVRQDKRQFVKAASTFQIRDWSPKTKPIHYYRRLAEEHMKIDTQRSKRWFSDLTNLELDNLAELVTGSSSFKINAKYTAHRALRCAPPSALYPRPLLHPSTPRHPPLQIEGVDLAWPWEENVGNHL